MDQRLIDRKKQKVTDSFQFQHKRKKGENGANLRKGA